MRKLRSNFYNSENKRKIFPLTRRYLKALLDFYFKCLIQSSSDCVNRVKTLNIDFCSRKKKKNITKFGIEPFDK